MPVVWIDPYITGAVATSDTSLLCAGTDTSSYNTTRNGSYSNPFKWNDFQNNNSSATTVNGVTIAASTEVRVKGKTMADHATDIGPWYLEGNEMYPASGNTVWDSTIADSSYSSRYLYLSGSNIDAMYPSVSGILKFPLVLRSGSAFNKGNFASNTVRGEYGPLNVVMEAAANSGFSGSFNSASTFCNIAVFKAGIFNFENITNNDKYHWFNMNGRIIKVSAGWTSETEQNGYSFVTLSQNDSGEYVRFRGTSVHFDCGRLGLWIGYRYFRGVQLIADKASTTHKWGSFNCYEDSNVYTSQYYRQHGVQASASNSSVEAGYMTGFGWNAGAYVQNATAQVNLAITDRWLFMCAGGNNTGRTTKVGSIYCDQMNSGLYTGQEGFLGNNAANPTIEFLNGSSYFSRVTDTRALPLNANRGDVSYPVSYTYPSTLYRPGVSGHWLSNFSNTTYAPTSGGVYKSDFATQTFARQLSLFGANFWELQLLSQETHSSKIPIASLGLAQCGSNNYKTTSNTIGTAQGVVLNTNNSNFPAAFGCETNDYDNKPILLLPDTQGSASSCAIAYNETVNSNEVVVLQNGGSAGEFAYGMEVQVPTDFDPGGSDATKNQIRLKLIVSKTSNVTSTPYTYTFRRNGSSTTPTSGTQALTSLSTDQANPTAYSFNMVASSTEPRKVNSVLVYVKFVASTSSVTEKLYIHDAYVETY